MKYALRQVEQGTVLVQPCEEKGFGKLSEEGFRI